MTNEELADALERMAELIVFDISRKPALYEAARRLREHGRAMRDYHRGDKSEENLKRVEDTYGALLIAMENDEKIAVIIKALMVYELIRYGNDNEISFDASVDEVLKQMGLD